MDQMSEKENAALVAELQAISSDIKKEIRHQGELNAQQLQIIRDDINRVADYGRENRRQLQEFVDTTNTRLNNLEAAGGKRAVATLRWVGVTVGSVVITAIVTLVLSHFFGG